MIKCRIEDNNKEHPGSIYNVVSSKSNNYFFLYYSTKETRKSFRHNVMGLKMDITYMWKEQAQTKM